MSEDFTAEIGWPEICEITAIPLESFWPQNSPTIGDHSVATSRNSHWELHRVVIQSNPAQPKNVAFRRGINDSSSRLMKRRYPLPAASRSSGQQHLGQNPQFERTSEATDHVR